MSMKAQEEKNNMATFQAFFAAINQGNLAEVNQLLEEGGFDPAYNDNWALCHAAANGHPAVVNRLLEIPEVLNDVTNTNNYALWRAAHNGHIEVLYLLVYIPAVRNHPRFLKLLADYRIIKEAVQHNLLVRRNMFQLLKSHCIQNECYLPIECLLLIAETIPGYFPPVIGHRNYLASEIQRARKVIETNNNVIMTATPPTFAPDLKRKRDEDDDEGPSHSDDQPIAKRTRSKKRN